MSADSTSPVLDRLLSDPAIAADPLARELAHVLAAPTGTSSGGFPFLDNDAYVRFRDRVPHILAMGPRALAALDVVVDRATKGGFDVSAAAKVVRGCILTAAITAPSDLWLLRRVIGALHLTGLAARILGGERIDASRCEIQHEGRTQRADARELEADLTFLLSRGFLDGGTDGTFTAPRHPRARRAMAKLGPPPPWPAGISRSWRAVFLGGAVSAGERASLLAVGTNVPRRIDGEARIEHPEDGDDTWIATAEEIDAGERLLPIVLGLRAAGHHARLATGEPLDANALAPRDPDAGAAALAVLEACGAVTRDGSRFVPTTTGRRVGEKGAGPMGIIEAYHPYMARLDDILVHGRNAAWVTRGANIAASQDANRESFAKANAALDAFCDDTGFRYGVFIEHAIGRGEATRQRYEHAPPHGGDALRYVGADLEDPAIDACLEEQARGRLPKNMVFVRNADIGQPHYLVDKLKEHGLDPRGAVMIVGNGFHEVRGQTDERMIEVFRGYCEAGVVLLFTEESALRVDDLLSTAWNTYHAGFKYVHEKSGQGLRPAEPTEPSRFGRPLQKSWRECAERAGYVRLDKYSSRSRTVHPLAPRPRTNPSISANHFCVPADLATGLKMR